MKKMLSKGFNSSKCKTSLKMAVARLKLLRNKKDIQLTQLRREVAKLLETGQDQSARIRVEHVVREEKTIAAYDLLDIYCELVVARLPIIETQKNCPIDLKEAVASIIFASPRCSDIPEFIDIRKHLTAKYGKEFATAAVELRPDSGVSRNLIEKLSANAPDGPTKVKILKGIAEENKIKWEPNWFNDNEPEPPANVSNEPKTDKIGKMHVGSQPFQPAPTYEPMKEIPSNTRHTTHTTGSGVDDSKFAYSEAGPPNTRTAQGSEPETTEPGRSSGGVENSSFGARSKWKMEFKDAGAAAYAAAESAEMASMAARAAVELASRGKLMDHASADSKKNQNEGHRAHVPNTDQDYVERFSTDNSFRERPSRSEQVQRDPIRNVNTSGRVNETNSKEEYRQAVKQNRPNTQPSNPPVKAAQQKENEPYMGNRTTSEVNPKMDDNQSFGRYDEVHDDEIEEEHDDSVSEEHDSSQEDSEPWINSSSSQVASKYEHDDFSYSVHRHDAGSVENRFHEDAEETRKQPGSYRSQLSGRSEDYGIMPSSDAPKFDDDPDEDPFDSTGRGSFNKEDLETEEPFKSTAFHSDVFQDRKDDVFAFSKQGRFGSESNNNLFSEVDDTSRQMEKDSTYTSAYDASPQFDDEYVASDDEFIQSPGRKSPVYSSPEEEILPRKWEAPSKRLYQAELTESFKKTDVFIQLDKPIRLGDDSDGANSENEDEPTIRPRPFARNILNSPKKSETEHTDPEKFVEQSGVSLVKGIGPSSGSDDLSARQQSSGRTRSRSSVKSYDPDSIARLLEEAERLSSPQISSLKTAPDVIDDSQDNYQSNTESITGLNVESLSGGFRNKANRLPPPPYLRGTSTYSSSSSISSVDDATNVREQIRESPTKKESINNKKSSFLQGTYFDPNDDDDLTEDSSQSPSGKKILDNMNQRSSLRLSKSYTESEDIINEESTKQTSPSQYHSRRTRASGQSNAAAGTRTETRATSSDAFAKPQTEPVIPMESLRPRRREENKTRPSQPKMSSREETSAKSGAETRASSSDAYAKPQTKPVIPMESLGPRRREENKTRPSQPKMSSREETSAKSGAETRASSSDASAKQQTKPVIPMESLKPRSREENKTKPSQPKMSSREETSVSSGAAKSGAEMTDSPKASSSTEKLPVRKISDKKPSHVHPNLPDSDDFASHFRSLRDQHR